MNDEISLRLAADAATARIYAALPEERRRKIAILLSLRLRELVTRPAESLPAVLEDVWRKASANGMTAEELETALDESRVPGRD